MIHEQRYPTDLAQVHNQCFTFSLFVKIFFQDNSFLFKSVDDFYHLPHASWLLCTCVPIKRLGPTVRCVCFLESTFLFATEFMPHNLIVLFTYANRLARKWSVINKYYSVPNSRKKDKIKLLKFNFWLFFCILTEISYFLVCFWVAWTKTIIHLSVGESYSSPLLWITVKLNRPSRTVNSRISKGSDNQWYLHE